MYLAYNSVTFSRMLYNPAFTKNKTESYTLKRLAYTICRKQPFTLTSMDIKM